MSENSGRSGVFEKFTPILIIISFALTFAVGYLFNEVKNLKGGNALGQDVVDTAQAPAAPEGKLTEDQAKKVIKVQDGDRILGSKDADIVMIEYSDFECPFCQSFHPTAKQAVEEYKGKVAWVYRHYPLTFHPRALPAANASECVANLAGNNAFWLFADKVFADQTKYLTDSGLADAAVSAGAKKADFEACFKEQKYTDAINKIMQGGSDAGITGTPGTFVINKKGEVWLVPGAVPYESLKATIEEALQK